MAATVLAIALAGPAVAHATDDLAAVPSYSLDSDQDAVITVSWDLPGGADGAQVCYSARGAEATATCLPAAPAEASWQGASGTTYDVDVRSHSSATGAFGPAVHGAVTANDAIPDAPLFAILAVDATSLRIDVRDVSGDAYVRGDPNGYSYSYVAGLAPPPAGAVRTSLGDGVVHGLTTDAPYTFAVYAGDAHGNLSAPTVLTATARTAGTYLSSGGAATAVPTGAIDKERFLPQTNQASVVVAGDGTAHAAYQAGADIYYTWKPPGGEWRRPVLVVRPTTEAWVGDPLLALAPDDTLVVVWTGSGVVHCRWLTAPGVFGSVQLIPSDGYRASAVVVDRAHRLHVSVDGYRDDPGHYVTNAGGRWHDTTLPKAHSTVFVSARLAYDRTRDEVAIIISQSRFNNSSDLVNYLDDDTRVSFAPAAATTFTRPVVWGRRATVVNASVADGRLAVVFDDGTLKTGTAAGPTPAKTLVIGGHRVETAVVAATSAHSVVIDYTVRGATWRTGQGVWRADGSYRASTSTWTWTAVRRITTSPYDVPVAIGSGRAGVWAAISRSFYSVSANVDTTTLY